MKYLGIALVSCVLWSSAAAQSEPLEKQALTAVQQTPAAALDGKLPNRPFAAWFNEMVGPQSMVVWQLAECGALGAGGRDLPACAEAAVILPNGNRVILTVSVGTFKKGLIGQPAFFQAVVESGEQLYQVRQLHDLPDMMLAPEKFVQTRPREELPVTNPTTSLVYLGPAITESVISPSRAARVDAAPPAAAPAQPQKVSEGVLEGSVVTRVMPVYPASARSVNAFGKVQVRIVVSEAGRVIEATAINGHPALRGSAMDAARKWVYKPTILNGAPVKVETILTFSFAQ
jgi:TonB family protein